MLTGFYPYGGPTRSNLFLHLTNSKTNSANSYTATGQAAATYPTTVNDYMVFNGTTQIIKFVDKPEYHVVAPYSVELEFNAQKLDNGTHWLATCGEGYNIGWPEWDIVLVGNSLQFNTSKSNNGDDTNATFSTSISTNRWYRVGFMFYKDSSSNYRVRGYLNGAQVFDVATQQPYDTSNGIAFGGDYAGTAYPQSTLRLFNGYMRNIYCGQSLFWTV